MAALHAGTYLHMALVPRPTQTPPHINRLQTPFCPVVLLVQVEYEIRVQNLEVYNEKLRDLLVRNSNSPPTELTILSTQPSGRNVPDATQLKVGLRSSARVGMTSQAGTALHCIHAFM